MKTFLAICLFILTGISAALYFGFDHTSSSMQVQYDDEQEGLQDEVVIKFSHVVAENTPKGRAARRFASLVRNRTNGEVQVEIYPNGTLYNDQNEYQALKDGHIQMIAPATSKLTDRFPRWQVLDLPYAFPTYQAVEEAYQGLIGETLLEDLPQDQVRGLTFWYNGYKQITSSEKPLIHPSDFERTHFRIMPSPVIAKQFEALGASTSELPFNKTYTNLEVDFINGQENTFSNIYSKKLYQEQDYLTISNHGYLGYVVLMNEDFWKNLTPDHQEVIEQALTETTDWIRRHSIEMNDAHLREMKRSESLEVHYLSNQQKEHWKDRFQRVYRETEPIIGKTLMEEVTRIQETY
ncbi:DctP family TRAP transporter solute-binding subunit [Halobacillus litoralis]|uniref:DctP family TRAP transporter solute-binding subunit n=1 Tax=Halobacillus litoralis TaxID=45668 RepID=UPI001CD36302|nr:DctP family TRAP transporter solute-binding subunit [Halobacillus litoralis]MCA0971381.1 DctP family TRAP transporter solute-binding subunit [Halobacillus litoralis]